MAAAQVANLTASTDAAGPAADETYNDGPHELGGGRPSGGGVSRSHVSAGLTGTLVLDGQGDSSSVWTFQVGSALTTASNIAVILKNGAQACNVFWQVGSSATFGTSSTFVGTSITTTTEDETENGNELAPATTTAGTRLADTDTGAATTAVAAGGLVMLLGGGLLLIRRRRVARPGRHA